MKWTHLPVALLFALLFPFLGQASETILVEAESFAETGGWKVDTQFIEVMGSPYLIAHGLGKPVADAVTTATLPAAGDWRVWVRTKDWVAPWDAPGTPGRFEVHVGGTKLGTDFGISGAEWHWQDGGTVGVLAAGPVEIRLRDKTGFCGRCDAICFTRGDAAPDNTSEILPAWRRDVLGLKEEAAKDYEIVFIGGGYAGMCGAVSAARMGLKVALIQNREVLGGNGSSEVRVWAMGNTPGGLYPVGDIIRELEDHAKASPGTYEEFGDAHKERIVRAEKNLDLFLGHHAFGVEMAGEGDATRIAAVNALEVKTGAIRVFKAPFFCDATGHGYIAMKAGADRKMIPGGRMGMSNMWMWKETEEAVPFPETEWALDLEEKEFPYPQRHHAQWFWESGFDKHPLNDLELIRDWNLRANFGAWNAIKNKGAYARSDKSARSHSHAELEWVAYVGGTRETQQFLGDVVLEEADVVEKRDFPDKAVLATWSIDLHYPNTRYNGKYKDNSFISRAVHGRGVDRRRGYPVPYRCFYSRNIDNLFLAGRNISVTHEALGTVRVMKTCGMMGVVVGKAAAVARAHGTSPRGVYADHLNELIELMKLPGYMRRTDLKGDFAEDAAIQKFSPIWFTGVNPNTLKGMVFDEPTLKGKWTSGMGLKGFIGHEYFYHSPDPAGSATFAFKVGKAGVHDLRLCWQPHSNRSSKTTVQVKVNGEVAKEKVVNQKRKPLMKHGFESLGRMPLAAGAKVEVVMLTKGADGYVHADALQVISVE